MSPFKTKQGVLFNRIHSNRCFILKDISGSRLSSYARLDAGVARVARKKNPIDFRVLVGGKNVFKTRNNRCMRRVVVFTRFLCR